mgnify:CR=1 FL=1
MTYQTTYSKARASLATLCDRAVSDQEVILIQRRGREDVALIAASELSGLMETAHLLRSPANAERLLTALARAQSQLTAPQTPDEMRAEVGFGEEV